MNTEASLLTRQEFDNVVADPTRPRSMPGSAYHNPEFFSAEVKHLFKKGWFPVTHEQIVPTVGDFYTIDLWDEKLVIVRGTDGQVRALSRCCSKSGRDLFLTPFARGNCKDALGNVYAHRSVDYDLQGDTLGEPEGDRKPLRSFSLESWKGFLLVNISGDAAPYSPELESLAQDLRNYRLEELTLIPEPVIFDMEANWKLVAENYIEAYHHLATHRNTFEIVSPARTTYTDDLKGKVISLRMPIKNEMGSALGFSLPPIPTLDESDLSTFSAHLALPLFLLTPVMNSVAWLQLIPVSESRSYWMIHLLAPAEYLGREEDVQALFNSSVEVHNEDMDACTGNHKGFKSRFFDQGIIHPELEKGVSLLDQYVLNTLYASDPSLVGS